MAKVYRYLNGLNNEVEQLEIEVDNIQEYLTKLKSDERIVVPLSKNYVSTRAIKLMIGYEINLHELCLEKIELWDADGNRIDKDKILKIEIPNTLELYKSRNPEFLCDDFDSKIERLDRRYLCSRHNPTTIKIYFNEIIDVKEIYIHTKRVSDPCDTPYSYTCLSVEYLNEEVSIQENEEIWYGIQYLLDKFTPENGKYSVDFSLIEGLRFDGVALPDDDQLITMKQLNTILQRYIQVEEFNEFYEESYSQLVKDVVNALLPEVLKQLGGYKY